MSVIHQEVHSAFKKLSYEVLAWSGMHMVQLIPLPSMISSFVIIQNGLPSWVPAYPGCPGKQAINEYVKQEFAERCPNDTSTTRLSTCTGLHELAAGNSCGDSRLANWVQLCSSQFLLMPTSVRQTLHCGF